MTRLSITAATTTAIILCAAPALAHTGPQGAATAGLAHPLTGADHVLAMLAVGLWAATLRGRATWLVPAAFAATMLAGFALATAGIALPAVEPVVLASIVVLGLALALALRPSAAAAATLAGAFALFHGQAHGVGVGAGAGGGLELAFVAGFAAATALLLAAGAGLGAMLGLRGALPRLLGAGAALAGAGLATLG